MQTKNKSDGQMRLALLDGVISRAQAKAVVVGIIAFVEEAAGSRLPQNAGYRGQPQFVPVDAS